MTSQEIAKINFISRPTPEEQETIRKAMSILGSRTSERKKASSRANAKRPRKAKKQTASNTDAKLPNSDFSREKITTDIS